jgi:hypothetical protein
MYIMAQRLKTASSQPTNNMTEEQTDKQIHLTREGMTVGQFAAMWEVPPWKADCRLRKLVTDGTLMTGNIIRTTDDKDGDPQERSVEAFAAPLVN